MRDSKRKDGDAQKDHRQESERKNGNGDPRGKFGRRESTADDEPKTR